ncbi:MAG: XTP/dITP diphosphatase [Candidatus Heimdallarchaeum endolithica]|uniref:XTP/dITP diphosphatase n=1 Tax=Candidatus Heimdallarchaeum endolithica TaxID=2876572 RepID=A0A9Y1BNJ8_9ARCH|nr:MAG: XTP/dITP diphosphatase [Candidatus Heimdallarchaeum endolithica]
MYNIIFITHNKHKFEEAYEKAKLFNINLQWINLEYEEIQDDSLEEIARSSCLKILELRPDLKDKSFFVEDAGLFINCLRGFPGPYSAYVFRTIGNWGILKLLHDVPDNERSAFFKSVIAYYHSGKIELFSGVIQGKIIKSLKGSQGFGFDPIFLPAGSNKTFAQMNKESKNLKGHRGKSLQELFTSLSKPPSSLKDR